MDVLKNKQYKNYIGLSRYSVIPYYYNTLDNKYQYATIKPLKTDTPFVKYKVIPGDTWDSIALIHYGNPTYYWVLCEYNNIQNCLDNPIPGTKIKIPFISEIQFKE